MQESDIQTGQHSMRLSPHRLSLPQASMKEDGHHLPKCGGSSSLGLQPQKPNIVHISPTMGFPNPRPIHHTRQVTADPTLKVTNFRRSIRIANVKMPQASGSVQPHHLMEPSINQNISDVSAERNSTQPNSNEPWVAINNNLGQQGGLKGRDSKDLDSRGTKYVKNAGQRWFVQQQIIPHHKKNLSYENFLVNRPIGKRYSNVVVENPPTEAFDPRLSTSYGFRHIVPASSQKNLAENNNF